MYQGARASTLFRTEKEDRSVQERKEVLKTTDDLKDLGILADGFFPSRYTVEWKRAAVGAGWRLSAGSVSLLRNVIKRALDSDVSAQIEQRQLQYLVRKAHEDLRGTMERCNMSVISPHNADTHKF